MHVCIIRYIQKKLIAQKINSRDGMKLQLWFQVKEIMLLQCIFWYLHDLLNGEPTFLSSLFKYIRCRHLITKGPQALLCHLYLCSKKWQLKDRRLHFQPKCFFLVFQLSLMSLSDCSIFKK